MARLFLIPDFRSLFASMDGVQEARKILATLIGSTKVQDTH